MKERPIIMQPESVRAILAGHKTQTRRVIKPQPERDRVGAWTWKRTGFVTMDASERLSIYCPYGQPGDRLWVRETWRRVPATAYRASTGIAQTVNPDDPDEAAIYAAGWDRSANTGWKPSIHMPRWASRITLEVTGVRVERVQDISQDDAKAEGVDYIPSAPAALDHRTAFAGLWNKINAKHGYGWDSNPWCWVIEFRRI